MILPVLWLLQLSVKATNSNDAFESKVHDTLMNIDTNDIDAPDDSTNFQMNIEPTQVLPTHIFPAFPYHSTQTVNDRGAVDSRCIYVFHPTESPYQLRSGHHDVTNLGMVPTKGAIRIKAPKQCVPKMSVSGRPFGAMSKITDNDMATFVLSWPIAPQGAQVRIYLPMMVDGMSCEYTLVKSSIASYQKVNGRCLSEFRMDRPHGAHEMPVFLFTRHGKIRKEMCWYRQSNPNPIPHWLRVGDHHVYKEASRVDMEVQTQSSCVPLIYRSDGLNWVPFGSVVDNTSKSRLPSGPRRQDTTYLLSWYTNSLDSQILIRFPPYANGRACYYEFESAMIGVKTPRSQPCSAEFTLTH